MYQKIKKLAEKLFKAGVLICYGINSEDEETYWEFRINQNYGLAKTFTDNGKAYTWIRTLAGLFDIEE